MKIAVFGATGVLGRCVSAQLEQRGHSVVRIARSGGDVAVDFRFDTEAQALRYAVRGTDIVVNTAGILIERDGNTWDQVHHRAVDALARACETERVARIVHVSALGAGTGIPGGYAASKLAGEQALARHGVDYAVVRPGLLVHPDCPSTRLFWRLARLPVLALPGWRHPGGSQVSPILATEVAECIARIVEHPKALRRVVELAGPSVSYRDMLAGLRARQGKGRAAWVPVPWSAMKAFAWLASRLPQSVLSLDTVRMLQHGAPPRSNETVRWLGREPAPPFPVHRKGTAELASIG